MGKKDKKSDPDESVLPQIIVESSGVDHNHESQPVSQSESSPNKDKALQHLDEEDLREARESQKAVQGKTHANDSDSDDDDMGPMPLVSTEGAAGVAAEQNQKAYGKALLPGEGEALVAYVQQNL